ncbi:MAG: hypothetical protein V4722_10865 [Bacteroidota bacterium]
MKKTSFAFILAIFFIASCKEKKIELTSAPLSDYWKPAVGKYITYRLDSTVPTNFGLSLTVRSYRVKDIVDAEIVDGLGRKAYRIYRTITDTNGVAPYKPSSTFYTVPVGTEWIEHVDNNLRYMKLRWPIRDGFQWKGHSFIDAGSSNAGLQYLADWNFTYENIGQPFTVLGKTFDNTISVLQIDDTDPPGPIFPDRIQIKKYGKEVYAKGIGLIYKEFLYYTHQPPNGSHATDYFEDASYGVKLRVIDYN